MVVNITADEILEVLGNESRRRILSLLSKKPCYVSEISYSLKMAPKVVIGHLERLKDIGIVSSYDQGRRRYYTINKNLKMDISITPHRFNATMVQISDDFKLRDLKESFNLDITKMEVAKTSCSMTEIYRTLQEVQEVERYFSEALGAVSRRFNQVFEELLNEIEREIDDEVERLVFIGITKGADSALRIVEEFGLPYNEVLDAFSRLKRKGLVEELKGDEVIWRVKC